MCVAAVASLAAPGTTALLPLSLSPNMALILCAAGVLLLFVECNCPGYVLPGAAGLLLLLLGAHTLAGLPPRAGAICLLALASAVLALPLWLPARWSAALAGTALLASALATLSPPHSPLSPGLGLACALAIGPLAAWLAAVAGKARRAKFRLSPGPSSPPRAGQQRWE